MSTILFNDIVFGPIKSRRLGNSLGVNLLPKFGKWCSFDCIYCECGWNKDGKNDTTLPSLAQVEEALTNKLHNLSSNAIAVDTITFSGNGEPTLHPDFPKIIDITLALRDKLYPSAKVSVLSNATQISNPAIVGALKKVDNPILKIDSPIEDMVNAIDRPNSAYSLTETIKNLKQFDGNFIRQTMFLKGNVDGVSIDCTNDTHCSKWQELVRELKPREVMMYTLDRETPAQGLEKVTVEQMEAIAAPLVSEGFKIQIKG